jgi:hypothetical protein
MFMHHVALCTPYIALVNGGHLLHMRVDHVEPKSEISSGVSAQRVCGPQASNDEDTNLALDQDKPRCIPPLSLSFIFETLIIILFNFALNLLDLYGIVAALVFSFPIILVYSCGNSYRSLELARHRYRCW